MIDIHSHLLPDIDDGSRSVAQSVLVLKQFAGQGITDVILTPHVSAGELETDRDDALERRDVAYQLLRREAPESPRLHLGFEIMLNVPLTPEILEDRRFSLAGSRYYLVEFFVSVSEDNALSLLSSVSGTAAIPLVAHAERYRQCSVHTVSKFRELGARVQVDATTLTRSNHRGKAARQLLGAGLVDLVAADNHGDDRTVRTAVEFLEDDGSADVARLLTVANTQAILEDTEMTAVRAVPFREGVWKKIRNIIRS
jgi:protein-tyrosine phosphatase